MKKPCFLFRLFLAQTLVGRYRCKCVSKLNKKARNKGNFSGSESGGNGIGKRGYGRGQLE